VLVKSSCLLEAQERRACRDQAGGSNHSWAPLFSSQKKKASSLVAAGAPTPPVYGSPSGRGWNNGRSFLHHRSCYDEITK